MMAHMRSKGFASRKRYMALQPRRPVPLKTLRLGGDRALGIAGPRELALALELPGLPMRLLRGLHDESHRCRMQRLARPAWPLAQ
jgi:hypothetical protein